MNLWMSAFCNESQAAARLMLKEAADDMGFEAEDRYIMSAIGTDRDQNVYVCQQIGPMEDLALTLKGAGAENAILLDQGASVAAVLFVPGKGALEQRTLFAAHDFRPRRMCVLAFHLASLKTNTA